MIGTKSHQQKPTLSFFFYNFIIQDILHQNIKLTLSRLTYFKLLFKSGSNSNW